MVGSVGTGLTSRFNFPRAVVPHHTDAVRFTRNFSSRTKQSSVSRIRNFAGSLGRVRSLIYVKDMLMDNITGHLTATPCTPDGHSHALLEHFLNDT